ncbi:MAG: hypothetical protein JWQ08_1838 [Deinococcus sp.]|nr:hypothetical protein [Deinococcus sp.]
MESGHNTNSVIKGGIAVGKHGHEASPDRVKATQLVEGAAVHSLLEDPADGASAAPHVRRMAHDCGGRLLI